MSRTFMRIVAILCLASLLCQAGCGTVVGMLKEHHDENDNYYKSKVYVGMRWHGAVCDDFFKDPDLGIDFSQDDGLLLCLALFGFALWTVDIAACFVVDTMLLPLTSEGVIGEP